MSWGMLWRHGQVEHPAHSPMVSTWFEELINSQARGIWQLLDVRGRATNLTADTMAVARVPAVGTSGARVWRGAVKLVFAGQRLFILSSLSRESWDCLVNAGSPRVSQSCLLSGTTGNGQSHEGCIMDPGSRLG